MRHFQAGITDVSYILVRRKHYDDLGDCRSVTLDDRSDMPQESVFRILTFFFN